MATSEKSSMKVGELREGAWEGALSPMLDKHRRHEPGGRRDGIFGPPGIQKAIDCRGVGRSAVKTKNKK